MINFQKQTGFTLVEIAIVLLIVTILLGYTMAMVPVQQELKQYTQANEEMDRINEAIYAFAQANGYLPCPANNNVASSGFECRDGDATEDGECEGNDPTAEACDLWYGFLPGKTLGLEGRYSNAGLLLDPWSRPYRYQVTDNDNDANGDADFIVQGEMGNVGIGNLTPDLAVCNADPTPASEGDDEATDCAANQLIIGEAPVVVLSTGKDANDNNNNTNSWVQRENLDNNAADPDLVFVKSTKVDTAGSQYDDVVKWISPYILYSRMIEAGQLP